MLSRTNASCNIAEPEVPVINLPKSTVIVEKIVMASQLADLNIKP